MIRSHLYAVSKGGVSTSVLESEYSASSPGSARTPTYLGLRLGLGLGLG